MTLRTISVIAGIICSVQAISCNKEENEGPKPTLIIFDNAQTEGNSDGVFKFKLTLDATPTKEVRVVCETQNGTAIAGEDFEGFANREVVFAPGETVKFLEVNILGDTDKEPDETFTVLMKSPTNATFNNGDAVGTLLNDDQLAPTGGYSTPLSYPGRTLVWSDEFEGNSLNTAFWTPEIGNGSNGWGNNELQYYRAENTSVKDGFLYIEARNESFGGFNYTSSRLITKGKKEFKYGRIDIRAALPEGQGIWPALWMLGGDIDQVGWPACGEIDIMELVGHQPGRVHGTIHYGADFSQHQYRGDYTDLPLGAKFSEEFHVFSIIWEENRIRWFRDDIQFYEVTPSVTNPQPWPFSKPHFFIFNIAVGGNWPGSPNNTTVFPQRMIVDYVRVFQ